MASDGQYPRQGPDVFFAVSIGGRPVGKLVFRLYYEVIFFIICYGIPRGPSHNIKFVCLHFSIPIYLQTTPKTAYNFHCLCTGKLNNSWCVLYHNFIFYHLYVHM